MSEIRSSRGKLAWMVAALVLAVIAGISWKNALTAQKHLRTYREQYEIIHGEMDSLKYFLESLAELVRERPGLTSWEIEELKRKGLPDPATDIAADLSIRKDLIPFEGVLGGTMEFYDIHVLTSRWVLAHAEDGHVAGHLLLEYKVSDTGKISWKVLRAYMD